MSKRECKIKLMEYATYSRLKLYKRRKFLFWRLWSLSEVWCGSKWMIQERLNEYISWYHIPKENIVIKRR